MFEYLIPYDEQALELAILLSQALHFPNPSADGVRPWLERVGSDDFRYTRIDGKIAAGLKLIWMGQWFGGVNVLTAGITVVGAAPEYRGKGATGWLMRKMHEEVRERGYPLACLFPATLTFYRQSGYERAGAWNNYEIDLSNIQLKARDLDVWPIANGEYDEVRRLYGLRAAQTSGMLERPPLMWKRVHEPKDRVAYRYLVGRNGKPEGYVSYIQGGQHEPIKVLDHCGLTREANLRLLTLFADHRSLATKLEWRGGPNDPWIYLLPEQHLTVKEKLDWVVRVADVERALAARGYPPGLQTRLELEIEDEQLPGNHGRYTVDIEDGRAEVRQGGKGTLRLDARTLAPLYTGYYTPMELKVAGRLEGDDRAIAAAQLAFGGPRPWMEDIF